MSNILQDLRPQMVFKYFEEISNIPRGSGNEKAISDYMVQFANDLGLEVIQDEVYNIIIKKDATVGYENMPPVILQGHLDMVCEKNNDTIHDFEKDPIQLYIDGDFIRAKGTTLGADNGVAIAYQMAILASDDIQHPPLEILMTIDEERGMTGVANMHPEHLNGKILINLDSEEEGEFLVSCAGGVRSQLTLNHKYVKATPGFEFYKISIAGLYGGHSGAEIHLERGNANVLMGRLLDAIRQAIDFELSYVQGGTKDNVITREAEAVIGIDQSDKKTLFNLVSQWNDIFKNELRVQDPDVRIVVEPVHSEVNDVLLNDIKEKSIDILVLHPNGVQAMSKDMENLVETSLNLGVVQTTSSRVIFSSALRSSVPTKKEVMLTQLSTLAKHVGADFSKTADYPAWVYEPNSYIREVAANVYEKMYDKRPIFNAIHAGLECGFISEKLPGVDMISFGPNIWGAHSPDERLSIQSTARIWDFLVELLKNIK